jgi:hypothetical protein
MTIAQKFANRLAQTRFGRRVLSEEPDLRIFKSRPEPRVFFGLSLIAMSYLLSLPGLALCGYLAHRQSEPLIMILGGGAVLLIVHLIFSVGVYLAGANYAKILAAWALGKFLKKHCPPV